MVKIGDSKADLMEIVPGWGTPCGGICWDLGHDARNGSDPAPPGFVDRVNHVHVHDLSPDGEDHHPLLFGNVSYREHLRDLHQAGYSRAIILEVDGHIVARLARERETTAYRLLRESLHKMAESFVARDS
jgi:sugar phosphate isomerase/epimerase